MKNLGLYQPKDGSKAVAPCPVFSKDAQGLDSSSADFGRDKRASTLKATEQPTKKVIQSCLNEEPSQNVTLNKDPEGFLNSDNRLCNGFVSSHNQPFYAACRSNSPLIGVSETSASASFSIKSASNYSDQSLSEKHISQLSHSPKALSSQCSKFRKRPSLECLVARLHNRADKSNQRNVSAVSLQQSQSENENSLLKNFKVDADENLREKTETELILNKTSVDTTNKNVKVEFDKKEKVCLKYCSNKDDVINPHHPSDIPDASEGLHIKFDACSNFAQDNCIYKVDEAFDNINSNLPYKTYPDNADIVSRDIEIKAFQNSSLFSLNSSSKDSDTIGIQNKIYLPDIFLDGKSEAYKNLSSKKDKLNDQNVSNSALNKDSLSRVEVSDSDQSSINNQPNISSDVHICNHLFKSEIGKNFSNKIELSSIETAIEIKAENVAQNLKVKYDHNFRVESSNIIAGEILETDLTKVTSNIEGHIKNLNKIPEHCIIDNSCKKKDCTNISDDVLPHKVLSACSKSFESSDTLNKKSVNSCSAVEVLSSELQEQYEKEKILNAKNVYQCMIDDDLIDKLEEENSREKNSSSDLQCAASSMNLSDTRNSPLKYEQFSDESLKAEMNIAQLESLNAQYNKDIKYSTQSKTDCTKMFEFIGSDSENASCNSFQKSLEKLKPPSISKLVCSSISDDSQLLTRNSSEIILQKNCESSHTLPKNVCDHLFSESAKVFEASQNLDCLTVLKQPKAAIKDEFFLAKVEDEKFSLDKSTVKYKVDSVCVTSEDHIENPLKVSSEKDEFNEKVGSSSTTPMFSESPSDTSQCEIMVKISDAVASLLSNTSNDKYLQLGENDDSKASGKGSCNKLFSNSNSPTNTPKNDINFSSAFKILDLLQEECLETSPKNLKSLPTVSDQEIKSEVPLPDNKILQLNTASVSDISDNHGSSLKKLENNKFSNSIKDQENKNSFINKESLQLCEQSIEEKVEYGQSHQSAECIDPLLTLSNRSTGIEDINKITFSHREHIPDQKYDLVSSSWNETDVCLPLSNHLDLNESSSTCQALTRYFLRNALNSSCLLEELNVDKDNIDISTSEMSCEGHKTAKLELNSSKIDVSNELSCSDKVLIMPECDIFNRKYINLILNRECSFYNLSLENKTGFCINSQFIQDEPHLNAKKEMTDFHIDSHENVGINMSSFNSSDSHKLPQQEPHITEHIHYSVEEELSRAGEEERENNNENLQSIAGLAADKETTVCFYLEERPLENTCGIEIKSRQVVLAPMKEANILSLQNRVRPHLLIAPDSVCSQHIYCSQPLSESFIDFLKQDRILISGMCTLCDSFQYDLSMHASEIHTCISFIPVYQTDAFIHHMRERIGNVSHSYSDDSYGNPLYICQYCFSLLKSMNDVRLHLNIHREIYMIITSRICDSHKTGFSYPDQKWRYHLQQSTLECSYCGYLFSCENGLINHLKIAHILEDVCSRCETKINSDCEAVLLEHNSYHYDDKNKKLFIPFNENLIEEKDQTYFSWNALDNYLNYMDGKGFRLQTFNCISSLQQDRSYLSLPIKVDPLYATIPEDTYLSPTAEMQNYLKFKRDGKILGKEIDEMTFKNFDLPIQNILHKKFMKKSKKLKSWSQHGKLTFPLYLNLHGQQLKCKKLIAAGYQEDKDRTIPPRRCRYARKVKTKMLKASKVDQRDDKRSDDGEGILLKPSRTRSGMKSKDFHSENPEDDRLSNTDAASNEISGEWVNFHTYVCCSCGAIFLDLAAIMDHKWESHPGVWCAHTMIQGQEIVPKMFHEQYLPAPSQSSNLNVATSRLMQTARKKSSAKETPTCSQCKAKFKSKEALHLHIIECGGLNQIIVSKKKNKKGIRFKRRKGQGVPSRRYANSSVILSTPLKNFSDRGSGMSTPSKELPQGGFEWTSSLSVVKRRLEIAVNSLENSKLKKKLTSILTGAKKTTHSMKQSRNMKLRLRKALRSKKRRTTRQSGCSNMDHSKRAREDLEKKRRLRATKERKEILTSDPPGTLTKAKRTGTVKKHKLMVQKNEEMKKSEEQKDENKEVHEKISHENKILKRDKSQKKNKQRVEIKIGIQLANEKTTFEANDIKKNKKPAKTQVKTRQKLVEISPKSTLCSQKELEEISLGKNKTDLKKEGGTRLATKEKKKYKGKSLPRLHKKCNQEMENETGILTAVKEKKIQTLKQRKFQFVKASERLVGKQSINPSKNANKTFSKLKTFIKPKENKIIVRKNNKNKSKMNQRHKILNKPVDRLASKVQFSQKQVLVKNKQQVLPAVAVLRATSRKHTLNSLSVGEDSDSNSEPEVIRDFRSRRLVSRTGLRTRKIVPPRYSLRPSAYSAKSADESSDDEIVARRRFGSNRKYNIGDDDDTSDEPKTFQNLQVLEKSEDICIKKKTKNSTRKKTVQAKDNQVVVPPVDEIEDLHKAKGKKSSAPFKSRKPKFNRFYHLAHKNYARLRLACQSTDSESSSGFEGFSFKKGKPKTDSLHSSHKHSSSLLKERVDAFRASEVKPLPKNKISRKPQTVVVKPESTEKKVVKKTFRIRKRKIPITPSLVESDEDSSDSSRNVDDKNETKTEIKDCTFHGKPQPPELYVTSSQSRSVRSSLQKRKCSKMDAKNIKKPKANTMEHNQPMTSEPVDAAPKNPDAVDVAPSTAAPVRPKLKYKRKYVVKKPHLNDTLDTTLLPAKPKSKKTLKEVRVLSYKSLNMKDNSVSIDSKDERCKTFYGVQEESLESNTDFVKKRTYAKRIRNQLDENSPDVEKTSKKRYRKMPVAPKLNDEYVGFLCTDCGLTFDSALSREDHRQDCRNIAFEMSLMAEDHLYECPHCQLTFALRGTQRKHIASCRISRSRKQSRRRRTLRNTESRSSNNSKRTEQLSSSATGSVLSSTCLETMEQSIQNRDAHHDLEMIGNILASQCKEQIGVKEICALMTEFKLGTNDLRGIFTNSTVDSSSTIIQLKKIEVSSSDIGNQQPNHQTLNHLLGQISCYCKLMNMFSTTIDSLGANDSQTNEVKIGIGRPDLLKALSKVEELLKEAASFDIYIKKEQMLHAMKQTFQAGTGS